MYTTVQYLRGTCTPVAASTIIFAVLLCAFVVPIYTSPLTHFFFYELQESALLLFIMLPFHLNYLLLKNVPLRHCLTDQYKTLHVLFLSYDRNTGSCICLSLHSLTLKRLMSYIYGAPILDVSRSHTTTQHSR